MVFYPGLCCGNTGMVYRPQEDAAAGDPGIEDGKSADRASACDWSGLCDWKHLIFSDREC